MHLIDFGDLPFVMCLGQTFQPTKTMYPFFFFFSSYVGNVPASDDLGIFGRGCIHKKSTLAIVRTKKTLHVFFVLSIFCVLPFLPTEVLYQICTVREEKHRRPLADFAQRHHGLNRPPWRRIRDVHTALPRI